MNHRIDGLFSRTLRSVWISHALYSVCLYLRLWSSLPAGCMHIWFYYHNTRSNMLVVSKTTTNTTNGDKRVRRQRPGGTTHHLWPLSLRRPVPKHDSRPGPWITFLIPVRMERNLSVEQTKAYSSLMCSVHSSFVALD